MLGSLKTIAASPLKGNEVGGGGRRKRSPRYTAGSRQGRLGRGWEALTNETDPKHKDELPSETKAVIAEGMIRLKVENNNRMCLVLEGRNRKHRIGGGGGWTGGFLARCPE